LTTDRASPERSPDGRRDLRILTSRQRVSLADPVVARALAHPRIIPRDRDAQRVAVRREQSVAEHSGDHLEEERLVSVAPTQCRASA
jgi:hypothetical protein